MNITNRAKQAWRRTSYWNILLVLLTAVIAVSNGCYGCYARKQLRAMNKQLWEIHQSGIDTHNLAKSASDQVKEMSRQASDTHELAVQAKNQADAAKKQSAGTEVLARVSATASETARSALILDQRPWVQAEHFHLDHEPIFDQDFWFTGWISNSGKTPATDVLMRSVLKWQDTEPEMEDLSQLSEPLPAQMVFPGAHKYDFNSFSAKMDEPRFLFFYQNEVPHHTKLYLLLKISYCDGFGNRYWTTMCVGHSYGAGLDGMRFCERGNSVGQDSSYKKCPITANKAD